MMLPRCRKSVLNVGGSSKGIAISPHFDGWQHVLLDIDPVGQPDILLDARELMTLPPASYDAVYSAHNLEHYHRHHGREVLRGMHHVLKPDGFLEIRVPDVGEAMRLAVENEVDFDDVLYTTELGPITLRDLMRGYEAEIEQSGRDHFAHKTGFSQKSLANFVAPVGFPVYAIKSQYLEITAIFFKQRPTAEQQRFLAIETNG